MDQDNTNNHSMITRSKKKNGAEKHATVPCKMLCIRPFATKNSITLTIENSKYNILSVEEEYPKNNYQKSTKKVPKKSFLTEIKMYA